MDDLMTGLRAASALDATVSNGGSRTLTPHCKRRGCEQQPVAKMGPYGGLCQEHADERRQERAAKAERKAAAETAASIPLKENPTALKRLLAVNDADLEHPLVAAALAVSRAEQELAACKQRLVELAG